MKKLILCFMLFSFLFTSQSFASQPLPNTNRPLEGALYCYLYTGILSDWGHNDYKNTFIYEYNGVSWPEDKIHPYVAASPFEMASLVTYTDRSLNIGAEVGSLYLGYWNQEKKIEEEYVFDIGKIKCPFTPGKPCEKYLQLNIGYRSFFVKFESKEKLNGTDHTGEYSRNAYFMTEKEKRDNRGKLIEVHPTKNPHDASVRYMVALRAQQMLKNKNDKKEENLKDSFKGYCNLEKLKIWNSNNTDTKENFQ
ncbi:MAG: hypothetical protein NTY22_06785 [Proteobacteria bacterium]|nr:hypothetical protein [Pseudomonadota bacterium]